MSSWTRSTAPRLRFHPDAYEFLRVALRYTVRRMHRQATPESREDREEQHVTGEELLDGIRRFALEHFGLMTITVFEHWGIHCTEDFGRMVFELVERGEMFKTDSDELSDFFDVYEFDDVFTRRYEINVSVAFTESDAE